MSYIVLLYYLFTLYLLKHSIKKNYNIARMIYWQETCSLFSTFISTCIILARTLPLILNYETKLFSLSQKLCFINLHFLLVVICISNCHGILHTKKKKRNSNIAEHKGCLRTQVVIFDSMKTTFSSWLHVRILKSLHTKDFNTCE